MPIPTISREEVDKLATVWCKSKGVIVMLDDVSRQFTVDVCNKALADFVQQAADKVAAKKAAPPTPAPSRIVLTD